MHLQGGYAMRLARGWSTFVLRGVLAIIFGIAVLAFPGVALVTLVLLFAAWMIVDGVTELVAAWRRIGERGWWIGALEGLLGLGAGVVAIIWPEITALALLFLVAAWSIITGVLEVYGAVAFRDRIRGELWLALAGLLSIGFGLLLLLFPGIGLLSLLWLVGLYAIGFGVALVFLGWRLRGVVRESGSGGYAGRP